MTRVKIGSLEVVSKADGSILVFDSSDVKSDEITYVPSAVLKDEGYQREAEPRFTPDGSKLVTLGGTYTQEFEIWDVSEGRLKTSTSFSLSEVMCSAFSADGTKWIAGLYNKSVVIVDVATGAIEKTLTGHTAYATAVCFSADGSLVASGSCGYENAIFIWEVATGACIKTLKGHLKAISALSFSPDGTHIASGSYEKAVRFWKIDSGECLWDKQNHRATVVSVKFSSDGSRIASSAYAEEEICVWEATTGECKRWKDLPSSVNRVVFSKDGSRIASACNDAAVRIWDVSSGALLMTLTEHKDGVESVSYSSDGARLLSGSKDKTYRIHEIVSGKLVSTLAKHTTFVRFLNFSPDGALLASASEDNAIFIWDWTLRKVIHEIGVVESSEFGESEVRFEVKQILFSKDSKHLVVVFSTGIKVWRVGDLSFQEKKSGIAALSNKDTRVTIASDKRLSINVLDSAGKLVETVTFESIPDL